MSFLSGLTHIVGNVAAPVAQGVGAVLPGSEGDRLSSIGKAISNPNVTYSGTVNPLAITNANGAGWTTTSASAGQNQNTGMPGNTPTNTTTNPTYTTTNNNTMTAAQQAANNQAIDLANYNLNLLPQQLQTALGNVQHSYDQQGNELQSGFDAAKQSYDQNTNQNGQQFVANKNTILNEASHGLSGLLRLLGQHGAGGSSAVDMANNAVAQHAAQERSGAGQTFGQNQQALDTNFNTYSTGFDNAKQKLADWLTEQQNNARTQSESSRQDILSKLAGLQSNAASAQPYVDQIKASAQNVANLASFNPTYTGTTPTYTAPDVASYTVNQAGNPTLGAPGNNTGASALSYLLGLGKDKQAQNQLNF